MLSLFLNLLFEATVRLKGVSPHQEEALMTLADQESGLISSGFYWWSLTVGKLWGVACHPMFRRGIFLVMSISFPVYYLPSLLFPDIISIISVSSSLSLFTFLPILCPLLPLQFPLFSMDLKESLPPPSQTMLPRLFFPVYIPCSQFSSCCRIRYMPSPYWLSAGGTDKLPPCFPLPLYHSGPEMLQTGR